MKKNLVIFSFLVLSHFSWCGDSRELFSLVGKKLSLGSEPQQYSFEAQKGARLSFHFELISVSPIITVQSSDGETVLKIASTNDPFGPIRFTLDVADSGQYMLRVEAMSFFDPDMEANDDRKDGQFRFWIKDGALIVKEQELSKQARYCQQNAIPLRSLDPNDLDFSDLLPLKDAIGDARILMLGEATHGDGRAMAGKIRLTRFLHEEMGFNVLAFEDSVYAVSKLRRNLESNSIRRQDWSNAFMKAWSNTSDFDPFVQYVVEQQKGDAPLSIYGIDFMLTRPYDKTQLVLELKTYCENHHLNLSEPDVFFSTLQHALDFDYYSGKEPPLEDLVVKQANFNFDLMIGHSKSLLKNRDKEHMIFHQVLSSLKSLFRFINKPLSEDSQLADFNSTRDILMGENLVWLANEVFPDKKIIVWAATSHIVRRKDSVYYPHRDVALADGPSIGSVAGKVLGSDIYSIGFTSLQGQMAHPFLKFEEGSNIWYSGMINSDQCHAFELEEMLFMTGDEYSFLDFRHIKPGGEWLKSPFVARFRGGKSFISAWGDSLDAVIFSRSTYPVRLNPDLVGEMAK